MSRLMGFGCNYNDPEEPGAIAVDCGPYVCHSYSEAKEHFDWVYGRDQYEMFEITHLDQTELEMELDRQLNGGLL